MAISLCIYIRMLNTSVCASTACLGLELNASRLYDQIDAYIR